MTGPSVRFLGGAGTVTGSRHLVTAAGHRILLDCGLFQGLKALRLRNWRRPAVDPRTVGAVVLSHAHLDHSGALPLLVREGFRGRVYCTPATAALTRVLLLDAGHLQEEDAARANRHGYSKHHPARPLFTVEEALAVLPRLVPVDYGEAFAATPVHRVRLRRAGHILGAASVEVDLEASPRRRLVYSGDLGRWDRPILRDPELVPEADVLLVESTYGDRVHPPDPEGTLARIVSEAVEERRVVLVPAFAVRRTQELMWILRRLVEHRRIPPVPIFVDSPMAIEVTGIYLTHAGEHDEAMAAFVREAAAGRASGGCTLLRAAEESKALNDRDGPMLVVSASGMATGGRILHHLRRRLPDPRTIVLLAGFQAAGTRGRSLADGATEVRIHGENVPVRARVVVLDGLSAHADRNELRRWCAGFRRRPRRTWVVHGEPQPADRLAALLRTDLGWDARVAEDGATVSLA